MSDILPRVFSNQVVVNHGRHPLRGLVLLLLLPPSPRVRGLPWLYASTLSGLKAPPVINSIFLE